MIGACLPLQDPHNVDVDLDEISIGTSCVIIIIIIIIIYNRHLPSEVLTVIVKILEVADTQMLDNYRVARCEVTSDLNSTR